MKNYLDVHSRQSNSFVATAFGIAVTFMLIGGYEASHVVAERAAFSGNASVVSVSRVAQADVVTRLAPIVVTARRG